MNVIELYESISDKVKQEQNGVVTFASFNIKLKAARTWLLDYISGDIEGLKPPEPYNNFKVQDYLSWFIKPATGVVENGLWAKPDDYYLFDTMSIIGSWKDEQCGEEVMVTGCDTPIELLDSASFDQRCQTFIKSLRPSIKKPIAKIVGSNFEFNPKDLGSIKLTYKFYPEAGEIKVMYDSVYNEDVPDPVNSVDCGFPEFARNLIIWYVAQSYAVANRESALTQELQVEGKSERG